MVPKAAPTVAQGGTGRGEGGGGEEDVGGGAEEDVGGAAGVAWGDVVGAETVVYAKIVSVTLSVSQMKRENPLSVGFPAKTLVLQ